MVLKTLEYMCTGVKDCIPDLALQAACLTLYSLCDTVLDAACAQLPDAPKAGLDGDTGGDTGSDREVSESASLAGLEVVLADAGLICATLSKVSGAGSIHVVFCCDFLFLPITSYYFMLLRSCLLLVRVYTCR